jgi:chorismate mutase
MLKWNWGRMLVGFVDTRRLAKPQFATSRDLTAIAPAAVARVRPCWRLKLHPWTS